MESRRSNKRKSKVKSHEKAVAEEKQPVYTYVSKKVATIKLQLRMDFKLKLPGPVTGKLYIWERAGAVVEVDEADAELANRRFGGKPCCGASPDSNKLFFKLE